MISDYCVKMIKGELSRAYSTDKHISTANSVTDNGCPGDSGGPLMSMMGGCYVQAGLASYGAGCGSEWSSIPGFFTRASSHLDWIEENTKSANWCRNKT